MFGECLGRLVAKCRMWACFVEVGDPDPDHGAGMGHVAEHGLVQELVANAPVETSDEAVLHGLA